MKRYQCYVVRDRGYIVIDDRGKQVTRAFGSQRSAMKAAEQWIEMCEEVSEAARLCDGMAL